MGEDVGLLLLKGQAPGSKIFSHKRRLIYFFADSTECSLLPAHLFSLHSLSFQKEFHRTNPTSLRKQKSLTWQERSQQEHYTWSTFSQANPSCLGARLGEATGSPGTLRAAGEARAFGPRTSGSGMMLVCLGYTKSSLPWFLLLKTVVRKKSCRPALPRQEAE